MEAQGPHSMLATPEGQVEEPTAAAHLTISAKELDADIHVPAAQARNLIGAWAGLLALGITDVLSVAIILTQAGPAMPPAWRASLVALVVIAGTMIAYAYRPQR